MSLRNTLIASLVLLAAGAWIYFGEIEGEKRKKAKEDAEKKVFDIEQDKVDLMTISREGGSVTLTKAGDKWQITAPLHTEADSFTPGDVARALAELSKESVVEESPGKDSDAAFGLDAPTVKVSFKAGVDKAGEILIGKKNPIGDTHYARVPDKPAVFLVSGLSVTALAKDLFALRNKKLMDFKEEDASEIEIALATQALRLKKESGRWLLHSPIKDLAKEDAIRSLLGSLRYLEATRFVAEEGSPLEPYGLQEPSTKVAIKLGTALAAQTLLTGTKVQGEESAYVKRAEAGAVAVVPASILADVQKTQDDLRENRAIPFDRWDAKEIAVTAAGSGVKLVRAESGDWQLHEIKDGKPGESRKADWRAVDDYLKALTELSAKGYHEQSPVAFDSPSATIQVTLGKGARSWSMAESPEALYVKDPDRPFVVELPADAKSTILKSAKDFEERPEPGKPDEGKPS